MVTTIFIAELARPLVVAQGAGLVARRSAAAAVVELAGRGTSRPASLLAGCVEEAEGLGGVAPHALAVLVGAAQGRAAFGVARVARPPVQGHRVRCGLLALAEKRIDGA